LIRPVLNISPSSKSDHADAICEYTALDQSAPGYRPPYRPTAARCRGVCRHPTPSNGQRQWIGINCARYRERFVVVLDEHKSSLNATALASAILFVHGAGGIAIVVAHRPGARKGSDLLLAIPLSVLSAKKRGTAGVPRPNVVPGDQGRQASARKEIAS
jgi:hypothetical protein